MGELELAKLLQDNPWFQALDPSHFQKFVEIGSIVNWSDGENIFREGDPADYLYLVLEGLVALDIYVQGRGRVTILTVVPNDVFGWSAVTPIVGTRSASARAMQDTVAIAFDSEGLRQACEEDHDMGYHVYRRLTNIIAGRLSATRLQLIDMYNRNKR